MKESRGLSNRVIEARAGLIPESDHIADEISARATRTKRIIRTVNSYTKLKTCGSKERAVTAILADLRHYCDENGMRFPDLDREGEELYWEERSLEESFI
jgi:hypothetical protein